MTEMLTAAESVARPASAPHGYLPIAEHGVVGDLHTVALVGTDGTIDWYCPARFDAPSVFGAILDKEKGGYWRIAPTEPGWTSNQLYFPDTNVLVTRFLTPHGVGEVIDFMPVDGSRRVIRRVLGIRGELRFKLEIEPRFDYARAGHETHLTADGAVFSSAGEELPLYSPAPLARTTHGAVAELTLREDETATFVLGGDQRAYSEGRPASSSSTRSRTGSTG
jgi:GH15 family glucan-1,4-alpha-glucosidase